MPSPGALVLPGSSIGSGPEDSPPQRFPDGARRLSLGQQRLWFAEQRSPGSAVCNVVRTFRLRGPLAAEALERGVNEIVNRHEILRATFPVRAGEPVLIVAPTLALSLLPIVVEASSLAAAVADEADRPFDLARGPLIRCRLCHIGPDDHLLIITIHNIVTDAGSIGIFVRELGMLYDACRAGLPSPLPPLPIQFADFAERQRERLKGHSERAHADYWKQQLHGSLPVLDVPIDRSRDSEQPFQGGCETLELPESLSNALRAFSRTQGATLFMTLLAAFQVLMHRHTRDDDIVVGARLADRPRSDVEGLIGFFVETPLLRSNVADDPTFGEVVVRLRVLVLDAQAHQEISFEAVASELAWYPDPRFPGVFNVLFSLIDGDAERLELSGLAVEPLEARRSLAHTELSLFVVDRDNRLTAELWSNRELFERVTAVRMLDRFCLLLEAAIANPDEHVSEMQLVGEDERQQVLTDWNQTIRAVDAGRCLHDVIQEQAARTPNAVAVVAGDERLTYGELDRRANQLAHYLRARGVGPDVLVGISVERSPALIVGLLAIMKAGGAYLPLDPAYPTERVAFMVRDAQALVLVKQARFAIEVPESTTVVCIDDDWPAIAEENDLELSNSCRPENLAYVIYTSGSSGTPKGVMIEHRSAVNLVRFAGAEYSFSPDDRVLQFVSINFDASVEEIFAPLSCGAALVLRSEAMVVSASAFLQQCRAWAVTVLVLPTAYWHELTLAIGMSDEELPPSIRCIIIGGESVRRGPLETWRKRIGNRVRLINQYGPTEATVVATSCDLTGDAGAHPIMSGETPIGRPIWNTRVFLLDHRQQPVPVGVRGEIYIGGAGLARGYLNRPELTADRFVRDPFDQTPGARLYRTGDVARYLPDGSIQIAGRTDQQVKVRGCRVELGEIEATLSQHPSIDEAVVVARPTESGEMQLTSYVCGSGLTATSDSELREHLRRTLPAHMIPAAFVKVESLPRLANGKIDRPALRQVKEAHTDESRSYTAPQTPIEQELAGIWAQVFGVARIGVDDNFFELGGHSLRSIELIARVEKRFGRTVPAAILFQSPTVAQMARVLSERCQPDGWTSMIPIQPFGRELPFFWIHGDSSNARLPEYLGRDRPLYAMEHQAHDGRPARFTEVETIAAHYLDQVRAIRPKGPYVLGGYSFGAVVAFEMAQQLRRAHEDVALLFMLDPPTSVKASTSAVLADSLQRVRVFADRRKRTVLLPRLHATIRSWVLAGMGRLTRMVKRARWNVCLMTARRLPPSLRSGYILNVYKRAFWSYAPRRYSGRVVIFKGAHVTYRPPYDWPSLVSGPLEIHEGRGDHMEMMKEPLVAKWAATLKVALEESPRPRPLRTR